MDSFFACVDQNAQHFVAKLRAAVAIPSVSGTLEHRQDVFKMAEFVAAEMTRLNVDFKKVAIGSQVLEGQSVELPPVILGQYGQDPAKKTLLVYGHYDVQPALLSDGWATDPWTLTEKEGKLYGRGSSDDKGPVLGWLWALECYQKLKMDLPVNLKFCFEGMEESGSEGLEDLIKAEAKNYFSKVDVVCISDNYWLGTSKPCLTHGLRGVSYFTLEVKGPAKDLHSGVFGNTVHEPMTDLVLLMSGLVKPDGTILVPGIMDKVMPLTEEEKARYEGLEFSIKDLHDALGATNSITEKESEVLMRRWRFPSLSLHGIEGAFYSQGAKTVIPAKVIGKFSIRTVPNMVPAEITKIVSDYIHARFKELGSKNSIKVECHHAGKWWFSDPNNWNFRAGARAVEAVYHVKPDLTREGGSIPITLTFEEELHKPVLLLPMGCADDGAHSINEKIDRRNYIEGIKLLGSYMFELSKSTE